MFRRLCILPLGLVPFVLAGCSANFGVPAASTQTSLGTIQGVVHGGQQAIQGAHVYVFAVGTSGYGGQSVSLLNSVSGVTTADTTTFSGKTIYYVTTSSAALGGSFSITGDYTCTVGQQVYLYAVGGSPDAGMHTNSAIGMMAGLGACPATGTLATQVPYVTMNEVSTVAAAYALGGFAVDSTHISSSGTTQATTGVANAMANVANIVNVATGTALSKTPAGTGVVPTGTINTVANILAACINTTSSGSSNCTTLEGAAANQSTSTQPVETATAAINIAHYPGSNVATLYGQQSGTSPFTADLSVQPNDFSIGIQYTGFSTPAAVAVDKNGGVLITNSGNNTLQRVSAIGTVTDTYNGATTGVLNTPTGVAVDGLGSVWIANAGNSTLAQLTGVGAVITGVAYTGGGLSTPQGVAVDGAGSIWTANKGNSSLSKFTAGVAVSGTTGYNGGSQYQSTSIAIDGAGYAWTPALSGHIVVLNNTGTVISGASGYTGGGLTGPNTLALTSTGAAWITNLNDTLTGFTHSGAVQTGSPHSGGGLDTAGGIAIDGVGSIWTANNGGNSISHFSATGTAISATVGYQGGNMVAPQGLAIDPSGNVWVASTGNNCVSQFLGAASPVITPISAGLPATFTSDGTSSLGTEP